ncbi:MAG: RloB family protein [Smithellaceae bacterium]|jgi:hypothetical protein
MGTDNLFHLKKARKAKSHQREKARRAPYKRILIVCEGKKTEPNYFKEFRKAHGLNPRNVVIADKKDGLDPLNLVKYAIEEYKNDKDFDDVYCVFDRDKHETYHAALNKIRDYPMKRGVTLHPITSIPCFEIWLLLHFTYTTKPFCVASNDSNCALLISDLKQYIPSYEKGAEKIYIADERLDFAIDNAKKLDKFHQTSGTDNPSTKVHELVDDLRILNKRGS